MAGILKVGSIFGRSGYIIEKKELKKCAEN
jgi:hypothetical protein